MIVLYNSDSFAVMQVDLPAVAPADGATPQPGRSGYEIVDKAGRKGIFLDGEAAREFRARVEVLAETATDPEDIDAHLACFTGLTTPTLVLH